MDRERDRVRVRIRLRPRPKKLPVIAARSKMSTARSFAISAAQRRCERKARCKRLAACTRSFSNERVTRISHLVRGRVGAWVRLLAWVKVSVRIRDRDRARVRARLGLGLG